MSWALTQQVCIGCHLQKSEAEYGWANNRRQRQKYCHDCVMKYLEEKGIAENYTSSPVSSRSQKAVRKDLSRKIYKQALSTKRLNTAKKEFYKKKKAEKIAAFKEMFPKSQ